VCPWVAAVDLGDAIGHIQAFPQRYGKQRLSNISTGGSSNTKSSGGLTQAIFGLIDWGVDG
jgi:hypothetical protein